MEKSIKTNFIYNVLLRIISIIFPLITFPYVARVLSPDGIGQIDFSLSVIQYFILISQVGIPLYGIRECAKYRDNKEKLTKTFHEIFFINLIMIFVAYFLFIIIILNVSQLYEYKQILILLSINIVTTNLGIEWFYQAIEKYKYITIRSIIINLISLILVFTLVKEKNDFIIYAFITVFSVSLGYLFNFFHAKKYISLFSLQESYNLKKHIRPILILFSMNISISIYINLDKVMLGLISGNESVGLYVAANKILKVALALVTSLGAVLLPTMSYYIGNKAFEKVNNLIKNSIDFILMISIPSTVGIIMLAKPLILLFAGNEYIGAISTIRIISPILIAIALSNLIGIQILVSHGEEKKVLVSTVIGSVVNFSINLFLISRLHQNGAAIGTLVAEIMVTITQIILSYSYLKGNVKYKNIFQYLFGGLLIGIICYFINLISIGMIYTILISVTLSTILYFVFLYSLKNDFVTKMANNIIIKLKNSFGNLYHIKEK